MKSIMPFDVNVCIECGQRGTQTHHCVFGKNRKNSEAFGLKIRLCNDCHYRLHNQDEQLAMKYRKMAQTCFEAKYGHEKFMEIFGRNYL